MKSTIAASFSLAVLLFAQPSFAKSNDPSNTTASELFGLSALAVVATPVLLTAGTGMIVSDALGKTVDGVTALGKSSIDGLTAVGKSSVDGIAAVGTSSVNTTGEIVKLVGAGGEALSDITSDAIDTASDVAAGESDVKVEIGKKEIPLKVRKDYLQMNEKVKTE